MPKSQKPPTARRLLKLLDGCATVRCDYSDEPPDTLSGTERQGVEEARRLLTRGLAAFERADAENSAEAEAELMRELHRIGAELGGVLRQLNPSGVFLRAHRDERDADGAPQAGDDPEVTMQVLRR